ncbi:membrane-anchored junction protein [Larimichthys crocea]|uniref:membrane-anchored junction protein n=1 Tax=Larimichthys crocea TaxID=215358 RepID=UPI000F603199|nr:membrane-anchored junction protein [Larimichthys crocea]
MKFARGTSYQIQGRHFLHTLRSAMPLQAFSFPLPETRVIKAGDCIYTVKIRGGSSYSGEEVMGGNCIDQELEEIIRTVLGNLDTLQPFFSTHFNVFPFKKPKMETSEVMMCKHCDRNFTVYQFDIIIYLEKCRQTGKQAKGKLSTEKETAQQHFESVSKPQSKRRRSNSPLEEAILKDLIKAEAKLYVSRVNTYNRAREEAEEDPGHVDEKDTEGFEETQQETVNTVKEIGTPGDVHPGIIQDMDEEEGDENREKAPVKPGFLTRVASHIFPFSLFFRDS